MASDQSARESAASTQADIQAGEGARQRVPRQRYGAMETETGPTGATLGFTLFAAVMMMLSGAWNFFEGLAAVIHGSFVVVLRNYAFSLSAVTWGWFHLIMGLVVLVAGIALLTDKTWARAVGVAVVAVSMIVNFLYIPYQPVWSIVVIAIDMAVLWALLTPRHRWT